MFKEFTVKNFRGFTELTLPHLSRVNLISGKNNTGKTALLEAIHLHNNQTNGPLAVALNKQRGIEEPEKDFANTVGWFFYANSPNYSPEFTSRDEKGVTRTLSLHLLDEQTTRERLPEIARFVDAALGERRILGSGPWLSLEYQQSGEQPRYSVTAPSPPALGGGLSSVGSRIPALITSIFLASGIPSSEQDVHFFGELELAKRTTEILPALQLLEPRLQRLSLVPLAGGTILHGDIGLPRLVPVPFMGEGMRRVLSFVLAIANAPGGVVLIDEVENGLHYSVQADVWKAIARAARDANVQVFATTHSYECIQSAQQAFVSEPDTLGLVRLDRTKQGINAVAYTQKNLDTSVEMNLEVR
jgi:predicted ATPase